MLTPGPWEIEPVYVNEESYVVAHYYIHGGPDHVEVADLIKNEADAKLIEAAPDLLAAARKVLAGLNLRLDHAAQTGAPSPIFFGIGDLHDAIAKAEGMLIAEERGS